jgi:hypothetical protein
MANGLFQHSQRATPLEQNNKAHFGQRPNLIQNVWVDVGRWPTNFLSFSIPGAMPLASMVLAVGQQNRPQKRNFKTNPSSSESPRGLQHGADV